MGRPMPEYTVTTAISLVVVVGLELLWLKTGIFRSLQYWLSIVIVVAFQILVDGWLTKLGAPIVRYSPDQMLGVRWPLDIPVEDFGFGFALVTLTLVLWKYFGRMRAGREPSEKYE